MRRAGGERVTAISIEMIGGLYQSLVNLFGDKSRDLFYRTGYEWALQDMVMLNQRLHDEIGGANVDLWQMDAKFIMESWWTPIGEAGWGRCTFNFAAQSQGLVFVELHDSAVAAPFAEAEAPVCHLYSGLFAGALSFFERTERHAVEIQCHAQGAASCQFIVGPGAKIDAAEAMRVKGTPPLEIVSRLH